MSKKLKMLPLLLPLILSACATQTTATGDVSCFSFHQLSYSANGDTPETVLEIRKFNAAWEAICG